MTVRTTGGGEPPTGGCRVTYAANSWSTGFTGSIAVANTGASAWPNWTLTFRFTGNQQVTQGWSAKFSQSGQQVTVTNESWNGTVAVKGSVSVGFNATYSGTNAAPVGFAVNGTPCTVN
ncbi:cellulose binding domain-containing protein [Micromonospora echinofusca]|uniref:cellulose binding domain-containing protein n=1 Tax=Micromonospora echinofusca TaxID=47858 RepID=UPI001AD69994|nr:cellulose binding domain-containing protein [Micromonospora echinofusca]